MKLLFLSILLAFTTNNDIEFGKNYIDSNGYNYIFYEDSIVSVDWRYGLLHNYCFGTYTIGKKNIIIDFNSSTRFENHSIIFVYDSIGSEDSNYKIMLKSTMGDTLSNFWFEAYDGNHKEYLHTDKFGRATINNKYLELNFISDLILDDLRLNFDSLEVSKIDKIELTIGLIKTPLIGSKKIKLKSLTIVP
ncbi:MAG: hypothetical protein K1X55_15255 [Chitinophagales bacterium]|nr:hypothetical protein [Chitinophagales bacterium]